MWGLTLEPALDRTDLLAAPVTEALRAWKGEALLPGRRDRSRSSPTPPRSASVYAVPLKVSANCVIIAASGR